MRRDTASPTLRREQARDADAFADTKLPTRPAAIEASSNVGWCRLLRGRADNSPRGILDHHQRHYPWLVVGMLWLAAFLNSADRAIIYTVMPQLREEFGLSPPMLAMINSVFFWSYAGAALLAGWLGDRLSRSRVIIGGLALWSVATGMISLSAGFAMLLALRATVAIGESSYFPTATALISDWHRPAMRGRALSLHQTAVFAGSGIGALAAGLLADRFGWRFPFAIFAIAGLALGVLFYVWLRDPPAVQADRGDAPSVSIILANPAALMLCGVFCLGTAAATGVTVWAPTYVHDALGLSLGESALYGAATINLAGFLAVPIGGYLADALAKRTAIGRFYMLAIGLALAAILLLPLLGARSALAVGGVLIATSFGKGLFDGCIYAAMHDVAPPHVRATAVGLMTTIGFIGAGVSPLLVAGIAAAFGMSVGLSSLALLYGLAVAIILAMRGSIRRACHENGGPGR